MEGCVRARFKIPFEIQSALMALSRSARIEPTSVTDSVQSRESGEDGLNIIVCVKLKLSLFDAVQLQSLA